MGISKNRFFKRQKNCSLIFFQNIETCLKFFRRFSFIKKLSQAPFFDTLPIRAFNFLVEQLPGVKPGSISEMYQPWFPHEPIKSLFKSQPAGNHQRIQFLKLGCAICRWEGRPVPNFKQCGRLY